MRLFRQFRHDFLEIARDVADGDVLLRELVLQALELRGEALGQRPDGFVLRLFDQLSLARDDLFDRVKEFGLALRTQGEPATHPRAELRRGAGFVPSGVSQVGDRAGIMLAVGHDRLHYANLDAIT